MNITPQTFSTLCPLVKIFFYNSFPTFSMLKFHEYIRLSLPICTTHLTNNWMVLPMQLIGQCNTNRWKIQRIRNVENW